jgi:hypothetical protein
MELVYRRTYFKHIKSMQTYLASKCNQVRERALTIVKNVAKCLRTVDGKQSIWGALL